MPNHGLPDRSWAYGDDPDQVADVFLPAVGQPVRSMVVIVHGGFWRQAYDRLHVRPLCAALAARGHVAVNLEYRRRPGDPDSTTGDVRSALRQLPTLRDSLQLAEGDVQVIGHSAGGHLALWLAAEPGMSATTVALAPVADLVLAEALDLGHGAVTAFLGAEATKRADLDPALRAVPGGGVTVIQGVDDDTVPLPIAQSYVTAMRGGARLVEVPDCGHFELIAPDSHAWPVLVGELDRLVDTPLAGGY